MDEAERIRDLAVQVGEIQLQATRYIAGGAQRSPLALPAELHRIRQLRDHLQRHVHGTIDVDIYRRHMRSTRDIETELLAIERSFSQAGRCASSDSEEKQPRMERGNIPQDGLLQLLELDYKNTEIARIYHCDPKTVASRLADMGIFRRAWLRSTTDDELAEHITRWWEISDRTRSGAIMTWGWLKAEGIPCTREQVRRVLAMLGPDAVRARASRTVNRIIYHVPFPNHLWHIDGHHKLIRWKMVVHGGIDGYSHLITYMGARDNNRADTVRQLFLQGTEKWGWPERVRADYGGENVEVGEDMERFRGKLWRHLREAVIDKFTANFYDMEERGLLNPENALHLYCLHEIFLPLLQDFLDGFVKAYNRHAQTGEGTCGYSPEKQWHAGFVNANRNGFAFDHYPNQEEEAREWYEEVYEDGGVDAGDYNPDNVRYPVRPRHVDDPHVHVDRFADSLPELLYRPAFRRELQRRSGRYLFDTADDVYVNILAYVKGRLRAQRQREQSLGA
ncbi:hypothetical protein QFC21_003119 [Naganishia friedmannii]|uniref:Uncharacterized protein n=1 Tax=Naganishia friedmannii TaxID=89922 RepID=A0ACC2VRT2_9TREE|nr:hypothetical protein QFC21_003119 [Naganishia friedmannii]